jgi:hypothetical protein
MLLHGERRHRNIHSVGVGDDASKESESDDHVTTGPASEQAARPHNT